MVVGARWADMSILETSYNWDFQAVSRVYTESCKNQETSGDQQFCEERHCGTMLTEGFELPEVIQITSWYHKWLFTAIMN